MAADDLHTKQIGHKPSMPKLKQSTHICGTNRTAHIFTTIAVHSKSSASSKRFERSAFTIRLNSSTMSIVQSDEKPSRNDSNYQRPVFGSSRKHAQLPFEPSQYKCADKKSTECLRRTTDFRAKVLAEFNKSLHDQTGEATATTNIYNVEYEPFDETIKYHPTCMVLDAKLRVLTKHDPPFDRNKIGRMFPPKKLFGKKFLSQPRSCVIVSSAGSLHRSGLGSFIGKCATFIDLVHKWLHVKWSHDGDNNKTVLNQSKVAIIERTSMRNCHTNTIIPSKWSLTFTSCSALTCANDR